MNMPPTAGQLLTFCREESDTAKDELIPRAQETAKPRRLAGSLGRSPADIQKTSLKVCNSARAIRQHQNERPVLARILPRAALA